MSRARSVGQFVGLFLFTSVVGGSIAGWMLDVISLVEMVGIVAAYFAAMFALAVVAGAAVGSMNR